LIRFTAKIRRFEISASIDPVAPLGWRFWTLAGFPGDPVEPRPYGGSRCLPLAIVDIAGQPRWLCAMELDRSLWLFGSHDLFPCTEQGGADAFAQAIIDQLRHQARLL
jgi:hypothetical protein